MNLSQLDSQINIKFDKKVCGITVKFIKYRKA